MGHDHEHDHGHAHDHDHEHHHGPDGHVHERYADRAHPEFVVLDIGAGLGALIVYADSVLHGREIEISPTGADGERQHKDVLERRIGARPTFSAVFDKLPAGSYTLWVDDAAQVRGVAIADGIVAELDWRTELDPQTLHPEAEPAGTR
jgi:hypothetical protein